MTTEKSISKISLLLSVLLCLLSLKTNAEGTTQLQPTDGSRGYFHISKKTNFDLFAIYGTTDENKIKLQVADTSETVFMGFHPMDQGSGDFINNVIYRVVNPSGSVIFVDTIKPLEQGVITSWDEALNGPNQLNSNGYDAVEFHPKEVGDYSIEFDPTSFSEDQINLKYFDVTVADSLNNIQLGRLHSKAWQISTGGKTNELNASFYPFGLNGVVYKVDVNKMQPFTFTMKFNSSGAMNTGDFLTDRSSAIGNTAEPEFEVFLSAPDSNLYFTKENSFHFLGTSFISDCITGSHCLNYTSTDKGILEGYVDVNNDKIYSETDGDVAFSKVFEAFDTLCIEWDGKDFFGNKVDLSVVKIYSRFGYGVTHLPLFDVEDNQEGFNASIIRPINQVEPLLFWDDSNPSIGGNAIGDLKNTDGCSSVAGCHSWQGRGNNSNPETINTWWFSQVLYDTISLSPSQYEPVVLSFNSSTLDKNTQVVCPGDVVDVFVLNHNAAIYDYNWLLNGDTLNIATSTIGLTIIDSSQIIIQSLAKNDTGCVFYDSLDINVIDSVQFNSSLKNAFCGGGGEISLELLTDTNNLIVEWSNNASGTSQSDLDQGNYAVKVYHPQYPQCGKEASFILIDSVDLAISALQTNNSSCENQLGSAAVQMKNKDYAYRYTIDNLVNQLTPSFSNLSTGLHDLNITIIGETGCNIDTTFSINSSEFDFVLSTSPEICKASKGSISIVSDLMGTMFNYENETGVIKRELQSGVYPITIIHPNDVSCNIDTTVVVLYEERQVPLELHSEFERYTPDEPITIDVLTTATVSRYDWETTTSDIDLETAQDIILSYDQIGEYEVVFTIEDEYGCIGEANLFLIIDKEVVCDIALPNAFSPNHDAINDALPLLGEAKSVDLKIFNRWGEVIYHSQELESKWDGTYRGDEVQVGVYPYVLNYQCESKRGVLSNHQLIGDISLLK